MLQTCGTNFTNVSLPHENGKEHHKMTDIVIAKRTPEYFVAWSDYFSLQHSGRYSSGQVGQVTK
jgi:hypothetical protein